MKKLIVLLAVITSALMIASSALSTRTSSSTNSCSVPISAPSVASTRTGQTACFSGLVPNTSYAVKFISYHYEGDPSPYILNSSVFSDADGNVAEFAPIDALAFGYYGNERQVPVYETNACVYANGSQSPIRCTGDTYVGYYPEYMWYYLG